MRDAVRPFGAFAGASFDKAGTENAQVQDLQEADGADGAAPAVPAAGLQRRRYSASADYFKEHCVSIQRVEEIPTARRACRIWRLRCPVCGTQRLFVQDFLRVRQDETLEGTYLYEYQELAGLLFQQPGDRMAQTLRRMESAVCDTSDFVEE